jgi:hypothetical protein
VYVLEWFPHAGPETAGEQPNTSSAMMMSRCIMGMVGARGQERKLDGDVGYRALYEQERRD